MSAFDDRLKQNLAETAWNAAPVYDTRGVTPQYNADDQGLIPFLSDNLAAGMGAFMETSGNLLERAMRPSDMSPSEWHEEMRNRSYDIPWLQDTGRAMKERNTHQYTPGSAYYYGSAMLQSLPEMAVDAGIGAIAGAAAGSALGPVGTAVGSAAKAAANATKWGQRAYDFYNGASKAARVARFVTPSVRTVAGAAAVTPIEASMEGQRAYDDYVEDMKKNGTYVKD